MPGLLDTQLSSRMAKFTAQKAHGLVQFLVIFGPELLANDDIDAAVAAINGDGFTNVLEA